MANYENSQDLKEEVLRHSGELTDGTSEYDDTVMIFLNRAYHAMLSGAADLGMDVGQPWAWAKKPYPSIILIQPQITTFLIDAANGSATVNFDTVPTQSFQGYYVSFADEPDMYRIKFHAAGSATATLDSIYLGDTALAYATKLCKYDYALDQGILRLIGPMSCPRNVNTNWDGKIQMIDQNTFNKDYPLGVREGIPDRFTKISQTNDMQPTVRFNRIPSDDQRLLRVEYDYIPVPDDLTDDTNSIPVVPRDHRVTLCYYAAYYLLMDKNDNRAAEFRALAQGGMMAMVRALKVEKANTNENYGRMIPRQDLNYGKNWNRRGYW